MVLQVAPILDKLNLNEIEENIIITLAPCLRSLAVAASRKGPAEAGDS